MLSLRDEMDRMFEDFLAGFDRPFWPAMRPARMGEFVPAVDVRETDGEIQVSAELPGMTEDDIRLELEEDLLAISGEKRREREEEEDDRYWRESSHGSFLREVRLPATVQTDKAEASYKNGILHVTLPKSEESRARRRTVEVRSG
jgi:HSP20 family protein